MFAYLNDFKDEPYLDIYCTNDPVFFDQQILLAHENKAQDLQSNCREPDPISNHDVRGKIRLFFRQFVLMPQILGLFPSETT